MNEVLLRPLFKKKYLESLKGKQKKLKVKKFRVGGLTEGERTALKLQPFTSAFLTARRMPGESELGTIARTAGEAFAQFPKTLETIAKLDEPFLKAQAAAADRAQKREFEEDKKQRELEKEFRNTFRQAQPVKDFQSAQAGFNRVVFGAATDSSAGDIALIFGYMRTLDPNSVVRESEFALGESIGGLPGKVQAFYKKFTGKGRLTEAQRKEIIDAATKQFSTYQVEYDNFKNNFSKQTAQFGLDSGRIELSSDRRPKQVKVMVDGQEKIISLPLGTKVIKADLEEIIGADGMKQQVLFLTYQAPNGLKVKVRGDAIQ